MPLPKPSIDTGAGLERIAAVVQGKRSNYDTDLFRPLARAGRASSRARRYGARRGGRRLDAGHRRPRAARRRSSSPTACSPSNEGRGYVLRRIMRRAIRHGTQLGLDEPFLHEVVDRGRWSLMGEAYPGAASRTAAFVARGHAPRGGEPSGGRSTAGSR